MAEVLDEEEVDLCEAASVRMRLSGLLHNADMMDKLRLSHEELRRRNNSLLNAREEALADDALKELIASYCQRDDVAFDRIAGGLVQQLTTLRSRLATVEAERDGLKRENSEIRTENARLGASLENCYSAIERLKREVQDEQTIFKWERDRVQKLLVENDGLKRDAERWKWVEANIEILRPYREPDCWGFQPISGKDTRVNFESFVDQQLQEPTT